MKSKKNLLEAHFLIMSEEKRTFAPFFTLYIRRKDDNNQRFGHTVWQACFV